MKNLLLVISILFSASIVSAQGRVQLDIDTAKVYDQDLEMAERYNVLLIDHEVADTSYVTLHRYEADTVILNGDTVQTVISHRTVMSTYTKSHLPAKKDMSIAAYGNAGIVNYKGQSYILTALHCLNNISNMEDVIVGINGSDIALIPLHVLMPGYPELKDTSIVTGSASFGYIHALGTEKWHYRKISGEIFKPGVFDFFFTDQRLEQELDELWKDIDITLPIDSMRRIDFFGTIVYIQSNDKNEIISQVRKAVKERRSPYIEAYKDRVVMRIDHLLYEHISGASGSILLSDKGHVIGVVASKSSSAGREKNYVTFVVASNIVTALEDHLKKERSK